MRVAMENVWMSCRRRHTSGRALARPDIDLCIQPAQIGVVAYLNPWP
jgi:hypothetical protein